MDKPYRFNGRFTIRSRYFDEDLEEIIFPTESEDPSKLGEYDFVFGPSFTQATSRYRVDEDGIRGAVRRVTCVREPTILGLHEELLGNQMRVIQVHGEVIGKWLRWFRAELKELLLGVGDKEVEYNKWVEKRHEKRQLRLDARRDVHWNGQKFHHTYVSKVDYKCKPGETLAWNKYVRAVGDLSCTGSLKAAYFIDFAKEVYAKRYHTGNGVVQFVKTPDLSVLRSVFAELLSPPGFYFVYFSDDSCVSARCVDGLFLCNMDISAADGSNYSPIFDIMQSAFSVDSRFDEDIDGAFSQLMLPAVVQNPCNRSMKVIMKPTGPVLYSGSSLTTVTNNTANTLIGIIFGSVYRPDMTRAECGEALLWAARQAGYLVKLDLCASYHDVQFLKHSPAVNTKGELEAYLNVAVWLRGFGRCTGDLPGRHYLGIRERAARYCSEIVRSRVHSGNHPIADAFRSRFVKFRRFNIKLKKKFYEEFEGQQLGYIPEEELATRYNASVAEIDELCTYIRQSDQEQLIVLPILEKIFKKDYGYVA